MTMRQRWIVLVLCVLPAAAFAGSLAKAGKWEVTTSVDAGMHDAMPPYTYTYCLSKEDSENVEKILSGPPGTRDNCRRSDFKVVGSRVSWKVTCGDMTGAGSLTFSNETFAGEEHMSMYDEVERKETYRGKYLGPCDESHDSVDRSGFTFLQSFRAAERCLSR